jgi:hypothetical protein
MNGGSHAGAPDVFLEFAGHVGLAVAGFVIICAAAILLELSTKYIHSRGLLPTFFVLCIQGMAYGLFLVDVTGFLFFVAVETWNLLGDIRHLIR